MFTGRGLFVIGLMTIVRSKNVDRDKIVNFIFKDYAKNDLPMESNQTRVMVYMKVLAINSVNVSNMEFSTDMYLRQQWIDPRLRWDDLDEFKHFNTNIVTPSLKDKVWLPDLFFRNGKAGYVHAMTQPNYLMRLSPSGEILYSQKISMGFSCQMNLETFPMDTQYCDMDIGSYGYTLDQLKFYWRPLEPMVLDKGLQIPEFNSPTTVETKDCTSVSQTTTGTYTCLKAIFPLERQLGSYLVSTFIPNSLIVVVSWLNFWISVEAVPARVPLGLLTLLGILTQGSGISKNLPRVSYIKAIDVWLIACIMFVIGALIEYAFASTVIQTRKSRQWKIDVTRVAQQEINKMNNIFMRYGTVGDDGGVNDFSSMVIDHNVTKYREKMRLFKMDHPFVGTSSESEIDKYSRFVFPACFILYNIFFWSYYIILVNCPKIN